MLQATVCDDVVLVTANEDIAFYEQGTGDFQAPDTGIGGYAERNLRFGVREHAMGAICNGIALHNSGLIPYCAT